MLITKRTKISLAQFFDLFDDYTKHLLFEKYNIVYSLCDSASQIDLCDSLLTAGNENIQLLVEEIVATTGYLRNKIIPKYPFDERWKDLTQCLLLDGYQIEQNILIRIEPNLDGIQPIEDDLTAELNSSCLSQRKNIIALMESSAHDFRKPNPDFNGCLSNSRIALETLVINIAENNGFQKSTESKIWGQSLDYLLRTNFINKKENDAISSVYTLLSDGTHIPLGFTDEEYVRFGRNLAISMCYFIIKIFNK
jgi:hypothetical protein